VLREDDDDDDDGSHHYHHHPQPHDRYHHFLPPNGKSMVVPDENVTVAMDVDDDDGVVGIREEDFFGSPHWCWILK
jgi:hypothetical protein